MTPHARRPPHGALASLLLALALAAGTAACLLRSDMPPGGAKRPQQGTEGAGRTQTAAASTARDDGAGFQAEAPHPPRPADQRPPAGLLAAHGVPGAPSGPSPVPSDPEPAAILLFTGNTAGWITPCGCPGSQAGGTARRAGYRALLEKNFPGVPIWFIDQGGVTSLAGDVQRALTAAVLGSMKKIGYVAMNAAASDFAATSTQATFLQEWMTIPRFSANVAFHDTGRLVFPPYEILEGSAPSPSGRPLRIGLIGLVDERSNLFGFGERGRSLVARPMRDAIERFLPELRPKADVVILVADSRPGDLHGLADSLWGVDLIVGGGPTDFITEPTLVGSTPLIAVGNQGKYMAEVRVSLKEGRPIVTPFVHWLDERFPEDAAIARHAEEMIDEVNEMSRRELARAGLQPADISPYVGAEACAACHEQAWQSWTSSRHARAIDTLVRLKRDYTASCVHCHVTASGVEQGGFVNPLATPQLLNVQCEQCHGPGEAHIADPSQPYGRMPEDMCQRCHTPATDPAFEWGERWPAIAH